MPANQPSLKPLSASPLQEGEILAGKYRIERVLGVGGMGVVVAGWHLELDQRVAIKFLHQEADERFDGAKRFRREARAAAKIRSEHAARVIDVGALDDDTPYIVMEYLEGNTLAQEVRVRGPLPVVEAVDYVLQAIDALAEVHALGIVHRDLKPANLFLALRPDGSRIIKLLDFGISKTMIPDSREELGLTRAELLIGSPQYMSPEQLTSAADVDARADIWSLGAILYKMLTRRPPYTGASIPLIYAALLRDAPAPLSQSRTDVPEALEDVILHCLAKDRLDRFASVGELAQALVEFCSPEARVYADRACRVLSVTSVTPVSSSSLGLPLATSQVRAIHDASPSVSARAASSRDALGAAFQRLGPNRWMIAAAASVLLATIAFALFDPWSSPASAPLPVVQGARAPTAIAPAPPAPMLSPPSAPAAGVEADEPGDASERPSPRTTGTSAPAAKSHGARAVAPRRGGARAPALEKGDKKSDKAGAVTISDFGGRR